MMRLLWALGFGLTLNICKILALPIDYPPSAEGISQFFDPIEERYSPCSVGVCKTYRTLPNPCVCTCFRDYQTRTYSEEEKRLCQDKPRDSTTLAAEDTIDGLHILVLAWLSGLTLVSLFVAFVLVAFVRRLKCPRSEQEAAIPENEPLAPNDIKPLNNNNAVDCNYTTYTTIPSAPTSSIVQGYKCPQITEPGSPLVTSPQPITNLPEQESSDSDQTPPKTMQSGEGENPVLEVGPSSPKLGLPGHDHHIREMET